MYHHQTHTCLQIVFGAMDTRYCAVANVAVWTEFNYLTNSDPDLSEYVFSVDGLDDPVIRSAYLTS